MDAVNNLISNISEAIYQEMKVALELGRWNSQKPLTEQQKAICLQAIIAYEARHLNEQERTAYIQVRPHDACNNQNDSIEEEQLVRFKDR